MNVLVLGGGGREHCLVSAYSKSSQVKKLYVVPGNGLMNFLEEKPIKIYPYFKPTDKKSIWEVVSKEKIDLVDVAQDDPLAEGTVDYLESKAVATFGPSQKAAQLEWSKDWSRNFMKRHSLPIPSFATFNIVNQAKDYIKKLPSGSFFVKASGLAAGKGAIRADNKNEAYKAVERMKEFGGSGKTFLIEECLEGEEVSVYAICDGRNFKLLKVAQDNKQVYNFDEGPNTGGMGDNAPALVANKSVINKVETMVKKTLLGMEKEGRIYKGVLYLGLIITKDGEPKIIEFNARWGDPETQVVLPGVKNDYVDLVTACIDGKLDKINISQDNKTRVCVVGACRGYPNDYSAVQGKEIFGIKEVMNAQGVSVYGAGVSRKGERFFVNGGRVLNVVGEGKDIIEARAKAYSSISLIRIEGNNMHYRTDIGWRDVERNAYA